MSDSMDYITNEVIFRMTFRGVTRREYTGYIVADTWEKALAIATAYCVEKAAHLYAIELMRDTQDAPDAEGAIVLIDKSAL